MLYPTLDRLGITRSSWAAGFHTFRHSAATIVNQKTGNLKLVQKLLGHSNLSTTADVYTHTSADADRSASLALEEAIFVNLFQYLLRVRHNERFFAKEQCDGVRLQRVFGAWDDLCFSDDVLTRSLLPPSPQGPIQLDQAAKFVASCARQRKFGGV